MSLVVALSLDETTLPAMPPAAINRTLPATSVEILPPADRERVRSAVQDAHAKNTRDTYSAHWKRFEAWCSRRQPLIEPLNASPAIVAAFLADRATICRIGTVKVSAAAIAAAHRAADLPDPTATPTVKHTLAGIARQHAARPDAAPQQSKPLEYNDALRLLAAAEQLRPRGRGIERPDAGHVRAARERVIVSLLFCAGLRRSEAAAITWSDVEPVNEPPDALRIRVRASKTNPDGSREDHRLLVSPFADTLRHLRSLPQIDTRPTDRLIPISGAQICRRLATLGRQAGVDGLSGHSGRHGLATELIRRGASTTAVQATGGWRHPNMVARYASRVQIEDGAVARYLA